MPLVVVVVVYVILDDNHVCCPISNPILIAVLHLNCVRCVLLDADVVCFSPCVLISFVRFCTNFRFVSFGSVFLFDRFRRFAAHFQTFSLSDLYSVFPLLSYFILYLILSFIHISHSHRAQTTHSCHSFSRDAMLKRLYSFNQ